MDNKINIYINSKNRASHESASKFRVLIPQNLLRLQKDEYFSLNVNGFYCFNSWYNCLDGFNNQFELSVYNIDGQLTNKYTYKLQVGNPNLNDIKVYLNSILFNKVSVTYDRLLNKFIFKRTLAVSNENYSMYMRIVNCEDFLGFFKTDRGKEIKLDFNVALYSNSIINVLGDEAIVIKISGDCVLESNSVDNFGTTSYEPSSIIFMKPIDAPSNSLLKYNNEDGGDSFQYKVSNIEQVSYFDLTICNQDMEMIPQFSDYLLLLQFVKHKKNNKLEDLLTSLIDYVKNIYLLITTVIFPGT